MDKVETIRCCSLSSLGGCEDAEIEQCGRVLMAGGMAVPWQGTGER